VAAAAFVIYLVFLLLTFVWRGFLQYRRTGDHGYRGLSGRVGSAEWVGGVLFVAGGVTSFLAPVIELAAPGAAGLHPLPAAVRGAGLAVVLLGGALTLVAQLEMGSSWRVGVDETEATALVTTGPFALVRNPIFTAMLTGLFGLLLAVPNAAALAGFLATLVGLEIHVRRVEEPYLLRVHGERYRAYAARAGRFLPGLGRLGRPAA
jgi:protein-S-isoprenylcysteine O-methyltransferase Ste14